jgi:hypothetical protein
MSEWVQVEAQNKDKVKINVKPKFKIQVNVPIKIRLPVKLQKAPNAIVPWFEEPMRFFAYKTAMNGMGIRFGDDI